MYSVKYKIPEDVQIEVKGSEVVVKGHGRETRRLFKTKKVSIKKEGSDLTVYTNSERKSDRADVGSVVGHIKNMISGVQNGVTYKLKAVYAHFPMTIKVNNGVLSLENFLGEKSPRKLKLVSGVEVSVKGQEITLTGADKEAVGLCASQIEQLSRVNKLDRRIFQDGIYIVSKDGKPV